MVDLSTNLGRSVPTPREVLEVIRPQLSKAILIGAVFEAGVPRWEAPLDPAVPDGPAEMVMDGGDQGASDAVFDAIREDALSNVRDWASDLEKVYDKAALTEFIGAALNECFNGEISDAVLDVLDLDEGCCESLGHVVKAIATSETLIDDTFLKGVAARLFQKV